MKSKDTAIVSVDEYIAGFPPDIQSKLMEMRLMVHKLAPDAEEVMSYGMPAYKLQGMLVYFAAFAHHIGFYPMPSAIEAFKEDMAGYKNAKGSVQFPLDKPLPKALITKMIKFRVKENKDKTKSKGK